LSSRFSFSVIRPKYLSKLQALGVVSLATSIIFGYFLKLGAAQMLKEAPVVRIEEFKAIQGKASAIRQSRTIVSLDFWAWAYSYECLFDLSGRSVQLLVSSPIFIREGETVRVVGIHNCNGVFTAVAYRNHSSGVSGNSDCLFIPKLWAEGLAGFGGLLIVAPFLIGLFIHYLNPGPFIDHIDFAPLFISFVVVGLLLVLFGSVLFVRFSSNVRALERLLDGAQPF